MRRIMILILLLCWSCSGLNQYAVLTQIASGSTLTAAVSMDGVNFETQFVDSTPFVTPTAVSVVVGARGNSTASVVYLESYN